MIKARRAKLAVLTAKIEGIISDLDIVLAEIETESTLQWEMVHDLSDIAREKHHGRRIEEAANNLYFASDSVAAALDMLRSAPAEIRAAQTGEMLP